MQTFLPYPDFAKSAQCLDRQRLGKQRVETLQIANALLFDSGWKHHPAVKMWRGYEGALILYGFACCEEWISRGYNDSCSMKLYALKPEITINPPWLGGAIHASHRSNLLRKDPIWYAQFGWSEPNDLPYYWPEPL